MKIFRWLGLIVLLLVLFVSLALGMPGVKQWRAVWDPNSETDLAGYKLYWRVPGEMFSGANSVDVGNITERSIMNLGLTTGHWEFAVTAYDTSGNESDFSEVVSHFFDLTAPVAPGGLKFEKE